MAWRLTERLRNRARRYRATALIDSAVGAGGFVLADVLRFGLRIQPPGLALSATLLVCVFGLVNHRFSLHRRIWRFASIDDIVALAGAVAVATTGFSLLDLALQAHDRPYWLSTVPNGAVLAFLLLLTVKLWPRLRASRLRTALRGSTAGCTRVLIVGAGQTGTMLAHDFQISRHARCHVVGFVDDDPGKLHMRLNGVPVLGNRHAIAHLAASMEIDLIAIAITSSSRDALDDLITICQGSGARVQIVSSLSEMATRTHASVQLRDLDIADLLGRDEVRLDVAACAHYIQGKVVMVTGAAGSIGSELCRQLIHLGPSRLVLLDSNETGLFDLQANLRALWSQRTLDMCIADITDEQRVGRVFAQYHPDVIFHAAAYKHVPLLEDHPCEAVKANVLGTAVLCRAAHRTGVERFVFISSDKAVAAANNLGYSKRIGELLMRGYAQDSTTIFCAVRFGNVIGSRGSVVPTFEHQIAAGGPVTVTDPEVTRFFMSIPEAACLVIQAAANASSGSIFMLDMGQPVPIIRLAEKMIRLRGLRVGADVEIVFTGLRPGEKMHEALTTDLEDTVPTAHAKIMGVIDARPVSREGMERIVRQLMLQAGRSDNVHVSSALRLASQGQPFVAPDVVLPAAAAPFLLGPTEYGDALPAIGAAAIQLTVVSKYKETLR